MEQILYAYYAENARKLHQMVDKILLRFGGLYDKDLDDFYSLANEVFVDAMRRYDGSKSFDVFLYSCLHNKIKTEMTRRNREKRRVQRIAISIDTCIDDEENMTLADTIVDSFTIEGELFENGQEGYSGRVLRYLGKLSELQRRVLELRMDGYLPGEIREELQISGKQYADCYAAIRSYRNVSVLL